MLLLSLFSGDPDADHLGPKIKRLAVGTAIAMPHVEPEIVQPKLANTPHQRLHVLFSTQPAMLLLSLFSGDPDADHLGPKNLL
jgi:hypothetical protein